MGEESPAQRGREAPGPVGREQILEGIAGQGKTGGSRGSKGMAKEWGGIVGYWRNGRPRNGVLEDVAMYWGWLFWHWRCSCGHEGHRG